VPGRLRTVVSLARGPVRFGLVPFVLGLALASPLAPSAAQVAAVDARKGAVTAYEEGRYADVLTLLEGKSDDASLRLLRARAAAELGQFADALDGLGDTSSFPADVQADLANQRKTWAAQVGRCSELGPPDAKDPGHLFARCALAIRDFAAVEQLTRSAKDLEGQDLLLEALVGLGETERAHTLARSLYVTAPNHRDAELFASLVRSADGKITLPSDELLERAQELIEARRPDDALRELDAAGEPSEAPFRARFHHLRGEALFRTRHRYPEAQKAYERAAKLGGPSEAHDAFHAARSLSRSGNDKKAVQRYREFAKRYPKSSFATDALYLAAWLSSREALPGAREELAKFASSEAAKSALGLRHDAHWDLAWQALIKNDGRTAERWLARYAENADKPMDRARCEYWRGRAGQMRKDTSEARTHFVATLAADPLAYYAQLAARRLQDMGEAPPSPFSASTPPLPRPALSASPGVLLYAQLGLIDDAARIAEDWVRTLKDREAKVAAWLAARQLARAYSAAEPLAPQILITRPDGPGAWLWDALLPRPYPEVMQAESARRELDTDELYAHMQVESRYQPRVVSGADALGLLQLLPGTAMRVASGLGMHVERADILVPSINIALGAKCLSGLVQEFHGQLPLAIAGYNAGSTRVKDWAAKRRELDIWVEEIPVEQTRNYVRRVLGAWARYRAQRFPDDPWGVPFPSHVGPYAR
jgi:soluble lytic murein transglycosylase